MNKASFVRRSIGNLFSTYSFCIPDFQRSFAWDKDQVIDLLSDLKNAIEKNKNEYFLGTIFLSPNESDDILWIIDGQQRLLTISLIVSFLALYLDEKDKIQTIQKYIEYTKIGNVNVIHKLQLSKQDNDFFHRLIFHENYEKPKIASNRRIFNAYKYIEDFFNPSINTSQIKKIAENWINFFNSKLEVLTIIADISDSYEIFEVLNDRGLQLAQLDLLKCNFFAKSKNSFQDIKESWDSLWTKARNEKVISNEESFLTIYMRQYWMVENSFVQKKDLYKVIKDRLKTSVDVKIFLDGLNEHWNKYISIADYNSEEWDKNSTYNCKKYIYGMNVFANVQFRPLIFSILKKSWNINEQEKSFKMILSWMIRNFSIDRIGGSVFEKEYIHISNRIESGKIQNSDQLKNDEHFKAHTLKDGDFEMAMKNYVFTKKNYENVAKYLLYEISNFNKKLNETWLGFEKTLKLDHISLLAKSKDKVNDDEIFEYYRKLGNLTILPKDSQVNKEDGFLEKKESEYIHSYFWVTRMLVNYYEWNQKNIDDRQKMLAKSAISLWIV